MQQRDYILDWFRVIAVTLIALFHYLSSYDMQVLTDNTGPIAWGCLVIFFYVSALLFGKKWANGERKPFKPVDFLRKRCLRIFIPLWVVILFTIPLEWLFNGRLEWDTILINIVGLGWARPFGISGHLWYITMLMILYFAFLGASRVRLDKVRWQWWALTFAALFAAYYAGRHVLTGDSKTLPLMVLFFGTLIFAKCNTLTAFARQWRWLVFMSAIVMIMATQVAFELEWQITCKAMSASVLCVSSFVTFFTIYSNVKVTRESKVVKHMSDLSYEVYLVHNPLLILCVNWIPDRFVSTITWVVLTVVCAKLLHGASDMIYKRIR